LRGRSPVWLYGVVVFALIALLAPRAARATDPPVAPAPAEIERSFQDVAARVSPAVVGIRARRLAAGASARDAGEQLIVVNGSGSIIRADGAILTNEHVVQAARDIDVLFSDGESLPATILAADPRSDLAVLQVRRAGLPVVPFCDWSRVARGQWAVTLGNPYGLGGDGQLSVSVGVISNLDRRLPGLGEADDRLYSDMIQVTAPIVPGNSGGPLLNLRGELVGIVTAMHTRTADDQGIGFAIPMTPARRLVIARLLAGESIDYGYMGVTARAAAADELARAGLAAGVVIEAIDPGGPADRAAVRVGDLLTHLNGQPVETAAQLVEQIGRTRIGVSVALTMHRDGASREVSLQIEPRRIARAIGGPGGAILWRGARVANAGGGTDRPACGVVVVDVAPGSPAERVSLRVGDVIERVGDQTVDDINAFREQVRAREGTVAMFIRGRGVLRIAGE
jgi:S1-C subfamily serine protease